jgi:selenocysteine-specific elongation factor
MIRVLGTAGHVDHGKSALVEALTGSHPDRLREEREREMTIDLGFAWTTLPDGTEVGIIDVPGHRDFIDNMLAGVGGFDAALLVVAADEGVMPQTREHLAILDLLEIPRILVVLTKIDLVQDPEWAALIEEDVRRALAPTAFAGAAILRASSKTGQGLDPLRSALLDLLRETRPRRDIGTPRLSVDRSFVMTGFGTVVTGTLIDGSLSLGDEVVILPGEKRGRIRGLQTHRKTVERAVPGSRVAVNVAGIDSREIRRGQVLSLPGKLAPTTLLDAYIRVIDDAPVAVRHNQSVKIHLGAADVLARARVLQAEEIAPGDQGWLQILLGEPVVAIAPDRFILRRPTPSATLGGGMIVVPHPARIHRRRDARVVAHLEQLRAGTDEERAVLELVAAGPATASELQDASASLETGPRRALDELISTGRVRRLAAPFAGSQGGELYVDPVAWADLRRQAGEILDSYHAAYPLREGMPREEFRSRLGIETRRMELIVAGLAAEADLVVRGSRLARAGFEPRLSPQDVANLAQLRLRYESSPASPPAIRESRQAVGDELWALLVARGEFIEVSDDVAFDAATYHRLVEETVAGLADAGEVSVAEVRDRYGTSRKYALALLEHLDVIGVTIRQGDVRRLKN